MTTPVEREISTGSENNTRPKNIRRRLFSIASKRKEKKNSENKIWNDNDDDGVHREFLYLEISLKTKKRLLRQRI